jgi:hypothetical protein
MSQMQSRLSTVASTTVGSKSKFKTKVRRTPQPGVDESPQGGNSVLSRETQEHDLERTLYGSGEAASETAATAVDSSWDPEPRPVSNPKYIHA